MAPLPAMRLYARKFLAAIAVFCVVFVGISTFVTLQAGTMQLDGGELLFSSLSVVRFRGIEPSYDEKDAHRFQIALHWFVTAFGWEWPSAPRWEQSCGIVHNIEAMVVAKPLVLPGDLALTATRLRLPEHEYQCLDGGGICHNEFLWAWNEADVPTTSFSTLVPLVAYYLVCFNLLALLLQEVGIRWMPGLLRCHCPKAMSKRNICACLKEGESLTPEVRCRMRTWYLGLMAIAYGFAWWQMLATGLELVALLSGLERQISGMEPELGSGFIKLSGLTLFAIILAPVCLKTRLILGQGYNDLQTDQEELGEDAKRGN
jgi:hypothetical protein